MDMLTTLKSLREEADKGKVQDTNRRKELLEEAKNLVVALEQPDDVIERVCFQLLETACIKTAVEMGIFKQLEQSATTTPLSVAALASASKADPVMLARILRCLAAWGAIKETEGGYLPATVSTTFANPRNEAAIETCFDLLGPAWLKLPSHIRDVQYANPTDPLHTTLHKATNTAAGITPTQIFFTSPHLNAFGLYMGTFTQGHIEWTDLYPVKERLLDGFDSGSSALMVDVGGGFGHQAALLRRVFPEAPGRLVVQDLPHMKGPDLPSVDFMAHDFNTPQPVTQARCYYLRFVIHDYDDDRNLVILKNLREAMKPGYSRLLINEWIIPELGASRFMTAEDLNMMSLAGMERTEKQHRALIEAAGLKVTNIYRAWDKVSESVIEAMRED